MNDKLETRLPMWTLHADTGGTFTDVLAEGPDTGLIRLKILSSGSTRARVLAVDSNFISLGLDLNLPDTQPLPEGFWNGCILKSHGAASPTTVLNSKGSQIFLQSSPVLLKDGDLVEIISPAPPPVLAARLLTRTPHGSPLPPIDFRIATTLATNALLEGKTPPVTLFTNKGLEDILHIHNQQRDNLFDLKPSRSTLLPNSTAGINGRSDASGAIISPLTIDTNQRQHWAKLAQSGTQAAICLIHGSQFPEMEEALAGELKDLGFGGVSVSSELWPFRRMIERAETTVIDASLRPIMGRYLDGIAASGEGHRISVLTSGGSLKSRSHFHAKDSLMSGPAGGVIGIGWVSRMTGRPRVIGLDMGGTSTDVSRYDGRPTLAGSHRVGPARILGTSIQIETVAAGGGSICGYRLGALHVGPESAGSTPGPACYGFGGPLTLTDVNLLLGRMRPDQFGIPVEIGQSRKALEALLESMRNDGRIPGSHEEILHGLLDIANEHMASAIRTISVREGYDPADYALVAFGGAGGQHGCDVAEKLGITEVLCPAEAGILSARGLKEAPIQSIQVRAARIPLHDEKARNQLIASLKDLENQARAELGSMGFSGEVEVTRIADTQLHGQAHTESIEFVEVGEILGKYERRYREMFGYWPSGGWEATEVTGIRIMVSEVRKGEVAEKFNECPADEGGLGEGGAEEFLRRGGMEKGRTLTGPLVIQDRTATVHVNRCWTAVAGDRGTLLLRDRRAQEKLSDGSGNHPILAGSQSPAALELFMSRFTSIATQMGEALKQTAISTNVKERLDFSCAILDREGYLVANAPHIPVHLGALGHAVREAVKHNPIRPGDVIVCNHPGFGGSHLPDITVIQGVFDQNGSRIGYVANRAHHAEIGGIRAGSMPPEARSLEEEGVVISPFRVFDSGDSKLDEFEELLRNARWPSRRVTENMADLLAQIAANRMGAYSIVDLAQSCGSQILGEMMWRIRDHARGLLAGKLKSLEGYTGFGVQEMPDSGLTIRLKLQISKGRLAIDFSGTSPTHSGNLNATPGIVRSAVIYCLRLWIGQPVPLNDGLLDLVDLNLPKCFLNPDFAGRPDECPAVVGGNTESSQNIVEAFIKAAGIMASSQGTMNNLIFGNESMSFYETIGGGSGAGPGFDGSSAVHCHMTNTAITDPEILEARYPVRLHKMAVRRDSGGSGQFRGGDGIEREIEFLTPMQVNLLTHHRKYGPTGAAGGEDGKPGCQFLTRNNMDIKETIPLDPIVQFDALPGDRLTIKTPGGGGCGGKATDDSRD